MLRNEKGFTLLEIIVAITILATAILALVQMFSGSLNQTAQADRYLNGVYLAKQKFSQLEMANFETEADEGKFDSSEDYNWQLEVLPYESSLNNEEARIKIQKISLRVYWEDQGQEKEVQLVTLKTLGKTHAVNTLELEPSSQGTSATPETSQKSKSKNPNSPTTP
jgi:general secretion pathway protein I